MYDSRKLKRVLDDRHRILDSGTDYNIYDVNSSNFFFNLYRFRFVTKINVSTTFLI